jgi:hypothetical protein
MLGRPGDGHFCLPRLALLRLDLDCRRDRLPECLRIRALLGRQFPGRIIALLLRLTFLSR